MAGIDKEASFLAARHTFATIALSLGINLKSIQTLMGHTQITTTVQYTKLMDNFLVTEMQKFDAL